MHWIIQENLFKEEGVKALIDGLERFGVSYEIVKVVPFSIDAPDEEQLYPNPKPTGLVMVCGSYTLAKIAAKRGWVPGSFLNTDHDYRVWIEHYGENLLNADSLVARFADVLPSTDPFFIRPCEDSKTFAGKVMFWEEFVEWRERVLVVGTYTTLDADTMVQYCAPKVIYSEARFFVVDGRIAGQSVYKRGKTIMHDPIVDDGVVAFAKEMISLWQPARAFVIDIADTPEGYKIVEINNINSSGFYAIDVLRFIDAIESMDFDENN